MRTLPSDKADRSGRERGRGGVRGRAGLLLSCGGSKDRNADYAKVGGQTARRGGPLHGPAPLARDGWTARGGRGALGCERAGCLDVSKTRALMQ